MQFKYLTQTIAYQQLLAQIGGNGVANYKVRQALINAGNFDQIRGLEVEPPDEFTNRWRSEPYINVGDPVYVAIKNALSYSDNQMASFMTTASQIA